MRFTHFIAISLCGIANVACQMDEIEVPREELFTRAFIKEFGIPDPDQDWNVATRVTANVDPALVRGAETISVYDCMPGGPDCQLAARFSASSTTFDFDFAKGNTTAYVRGENSDGSIVFSGFYPIENGILRVSSGSSRAIEYEDASSIKLEYINENNNLNNGIGYFNPNTRKIVNGKPVDGWSCNFEYWKKTINYSGAENRGILSVLNLYGLYSGSSFSSSYLKGKFDSEEVGTPSSSLANIVGSNGVFYEGVRQYNNQYICNLSRYKDILNPQNGVTYTSEGGEIVLKYLYGAGIFSNSFGYFYYRDGASMQEIMEAPKFILMYDASPWNNLQRKAPDDDSYRNFPDIDKTEGIDNYSGMRTAKDIEENINSNYRPSYHKLVHYEIGEDNKPIEGTASYTFPKGLKIGFFVIVQGYERIRLNGNLAGKGNAQNNNHYKVEGPDFRFSLPWMNQLFGAYYERNSSHNDEIYPETGITFTFKDNTSTTTEANPGYAPHMSFVTYKYNGQTVMGVEDGKYHDNDHDMNDIIFYVSGVENDQEEIGQDPMAQSWIVACEDLGSFHDFDFNDVVFGLSYFATDKDEDRCLKVKALAAGGTLPVQLMWTDPNGTVHNLGAENGYTRWNDWFGVSNENQIINCNHNRDYQYQGKTVTIPLKDFPDYAISPNSYLNEGEKYPMGGFSIGVYENGDYKFTREVKPLGNYTEGAETWSKTPQMILLHRTWRWPIECKPIFDAYSDGYVTGPDKYTKQAGFRTWISDKYSTEWTSLPSDTEVVVEHNWRGESFSSTTRQ